MRRKERYIANGFLLGLLTGAAMDILSQRQIVLKNGEVFDWYNIDTKRLLKNSFLGGTIGGISGFGIYEIMRLLENKEPFSKEQYLKGVLNVNDLRQIPSLLNETVSIKKRIIEAIFSHFEHQLLVKPFIAGSFGRHTAINLDFDVDIIVPFKKDSFRSTNVMFNTLGELIKKKFSSPEFQLHKLKKGFQIEYLSSDNGSLYFDVVPGKERSNFFIDGQLTLFKRSKNIFTTSSTFKSVPRIHRDFTKNHPNARKVIKLLKVWKAEKAAYLPSIALENLVVDSFQKGYCSEQMRLSENLVNSMYYLSTMIESYKVKDKANSNNTLCSGMSDSDRMSISRDLIKDSEYILKNPFNLKEIFPLSDS